MRIIEILNDIKPVWISQIATGLARGENVRKNFQGQLEEFFDLLQQSIRTGDPNWLNPILDRWIATKTQTELSLDRTSVIPIIDHILKASVVIANNYLDSADGLTFISSITPVYTHAYDYISQKEYNSQINKVSKELEKVKKSLENLDKSKSDFIAVAAHELKTPLTLIEGYATMLRETFPKEDNESDAILLLKGMDNGIRRLQTIINDMIDVSLIDNNMLKLNFQPIWINKILTASQRELTRFLNERSQIFKVLDFSGSDEMTYGDPERLKQAFINIFSNAIKYTPDGGRITVDGRKLPGFIEITITDTGIGIDESFHEIIFEKFGRLGDIQRHSSGKTKYKGGGPGLGLPITKGLIEAHGGTIWVESDGYDEILCPGTTFHVLLPIVKEPPDKKIAKLFEPLINIYDHADAESNITND